jgi:drug/metabolite transporter (DMT)-like permease
MNLPWSVGEPITHTALALLVFCILMEIGKELSFKVAATRAADAKSYATAVAAQPLMWLGVILWAIETIGWVLTLQLAPLALAYSINSFVYAGIPLAGALLLKERLSKRKMAGVAMVTAGVLCVAASRF